jgi:hypothetical protein
VVRAATDVTVNGVQLHRQTGDGHAGDSVDAQKTWTGTPGLIANTTTCQQFVAKTAVSLGQVNYTAVGGKIGNSINPGTFFYYATIITTVPNQVVTVTQSNNSSNSAALFGVQQGQGLLWSADCSQKVLVGTNSGVNGSTVSYTIAVPGTYIIAVKYTTKSLAGMTAPVPSDITYSFLNSLGGPASVPLKHS